MAFLQQLLSGTDLAALKQAAPIAFDLAGDVWGLDPKRAGFIAHEMPSRPAMTVRTSPDVLLRLLSEKEFALRADEELTVLGDPAPLVAVIEALSGGASPLATRMSAMGAMSKARR
jgi:hypothetical protein